jgi:hypothetical protein
MQLHQSPTKHPLPYYSGEPDSQNEFLISSKSRIERHGVDTDTDLEYDPDNLAFFSLSLS